MTIEAYTDWRGIAEKHEARIAELVESLDRFMQDNSNLESVNSELCESIGKALNEITSDGHCNWVYREIRNIYSTLKQALFTHDRARHDEMFPLPVDPPGHATLQAEEGQDV